MFTKVRRKVIAAFLLVAIVCCFGMVFSGGGETKVSAAAPSNLSNSVISHFVFKSEVAVNSAVLYFGDEQFLSRPAATRPWLVSGATPISTNDRFNNLSESMASSISADGKTLTFPNYCTNSAVTYGYFTILASTSKYGEPGMTYAWTYVTKWVADSMNNTVGKWTDISGHQVTADMFDLANNKVATYKTAIPLGSNVLGVSYMSIPTYEITLNNTGGTGTEKTTAVYNNIPGYVFVPTKVGYTFEGYYDTNAATGGIKYMEYKILNGNHLAWPTRKWEKFDVGTLYARWTPNQIAVTSPTAASGTYGAAFAYNFAVSNDTGAAISVALKSGTMPKGLAISGSRITGAPTAVYPNGTTVVFTVTGANGTKVDHTIVFTIAKANQSTLSINSASSAAFGTAYTFTTTGGQGTGGVTFARVGGTAPSGYTVSSAGALTMPATGGLGTIIVQATKALDNNYNATTSAQFTLTITAANLSGSVITAPGNQTYTGKALQPKPNVTFNGAAITEPKDFTYSWTSNTNAGTATLTITAKAGGNFTGTKSINFSIVAASLSGAVIAAPGNQTYTGTAFQPKPNVTFGGLAITEPKDFTYSWTNNINAGTATLTITAKAGGNFTGTKSIDFSIATASLSGAVITAPGNQIYTGMAIQPKPSVTFGGLAITEPKDFTYSWTSNINVGKATLTITAKAGGNFTGTKSIDFDIVKAEQPTFSITNKPASIWVLGNSGNTLSLTTSGGLSSVIAEYVSSDESIATVDADGNVTFLKAGTVTITVKKAENANYNEASDSFTIEVKDNVAFIGNTYYDTIENAFANAVSGDTIELTKDTTVTKEILVKDSTLTLTGGASKFTLTAAKAGSFSIKGIGNLTIESIILDGAANWVQGTDGLNSNSNASAARGGLSVIEVWDAASVFNLNNAVIQNMDAQSAIGIIKSVGTINIDGSVIQNNLTAMGGAIVISGGTANVIDSSLIKNQAQNGGAIYFYGANNTSSATVNLVGSTLSDNIVMGEGSAVYMTYGGTFTVDNTTSVSGIIYLGANADGSETAVVTVVGASMNKLIVYVDAKAVEYYHESSAEPKPTIVIVESKDAEISADDLKLNVSVKNAGITADVTVGSGQLRIMETTEYAAALQVGEKVEWFKSLNAAIAYLKSNTIKAATVYIVDSFNESGNGWVNNKTVLLTEGVVIPSGYNVTFESAKRNVAADDVTVTLQPIGSDVITLKRAEGQVSAMISVGNGGAVTVNNLVIDGGAVWEGGSAANSITATNSVAGNVEYINGGNSGVAANAPIIKNMGGLTLESEAILQNNENKFAVFGSPNYGGGVANLGTASFDMKENSVIQNCYAREGGGVQNINGGRHTNFGTGTNSVAINGKILDCVSHTKGAAVETIYGNATTTVGEKAELSGNVSLTNQGVLTVEEGGVLEVKGGRVSATEGKYAIYTYNKYSKTDIVEVNGNTPFLEGKNAAELKINGAPIITGKIYLDDNCKLANDEAREFKPFVNMTGYTGSGELTVALKGTKGADAVIATGTTDKVKTEIDKTGIHKLSDVFEYTYSATEIRLGSYQIEVMQSGLEGFTISGTAYGISEITINGVTINVVNNKFEEKMTLKSVKFPTPHGGVINYNADGKIEIEADNFAKLATSCIPFGKGETAKDLKFGALTMDESYNIYAPAGTTYKTEDGREVLRTNALLPNDIYIDENGFATFYIEGDGERETTVEIGVRDITPPSGGKYVGVTADSITITTEEGSEYVLMDENGDLITKWAQGDGSNFTFEGLNPETKYTVVMRKKNTSSAPNKFIVADEVTTLKVGETAESLLAAFMEEYKKVEAKLSPSKFGELMGGTADLAKVFEEFEKLSPTMKVLVKDEFKLLKQTEKALELKVEFDKYAKADYLDEDYEDIKDIYLTAIDKLFTKATDEDRTDVFDRAVEDMAAILSKQTRVDEAKQSLTNYLAPNDTQAVKDIIAGGHAATESITTFESMNKLVADTKLLVDKKRAEQNVKEKYGEIELKDEFIGMTADEQKRISDKRDEILADIEAAADKAGVDEALSRLSEIYIEFGKTQIDGLRGTDDSAEVTGILNKAITDIGNETVEVKIDELVKKAKLDIAKQKAVEEITAALEEIKTREDYAKYTAEEKAAIEKVKTDAIAEINALVDPDFDYVAELDMIVNKTNFELEYKNAIGKINAIEETTDSEEAKKIIDDAVADLIGGVDGGTILTADEIAGIVADAKAAVELDRDKNSAIDGLNGFIKDIDSDEAKKIVEDAIAELNEGVSGGTILTADEIAKIVADAKAAVELDRDKNSAIDELNKYIKDTDSDEAKKIIEDAILALIEGVDGGTILTADEIAKVVADAKEAVELDREKNKAIDDLNEWFNKLIDSGKYTEAGEKELEAIYEKSLEDIEGGNSKAEYVGIVEKAKEDLKGINVGAIGNGITPGGGSNVTPDEYPDYSDEVDENKDGFIGGITSSGNSGLSSDWSLSIKKTDLSKDQKKNLEQIDKNLSVGRMIQVSLTDGAGKVVAAPDGTYTVSMLLPKDLRGSNDIKIVATDANGNTKVLLATRSGDFITFETDNLGTFAVLSDKVVDLTWAIVALSAIILIELIFIVLLAVRKRKKNDDDDSDKDANESNDGKKKSDVKTYSSALPLVILGAIVYAPASAISIILALAAVVLCLGGVIIYLALKGHKSAASEEVMEAPEEELVTEEPIATALEEHAKEDEIKAEEAASEPEELQLAEEETEAVAAEEEQTVCEEEQAVCEEETKEETVEAEAAIEEVVSTVITEEIAEAEESEDVAEEVASEPEELQETEEETEVVAAEEEAKGIEAIADAEAEKGSALVEQAEAESVIDNADEASAENEDFDAQMPIIVATNDSDNTDEDESLPIADSSEAEIDETDEESELGGKLNKKSTLVIISGDEQDSGFVARYNKSFTAKMIMSGDDTKEFYTQIKNEMLSYSGVKSRISWKGERFNKGRKTLMKLSVNGKTLHVYYALPQQDVDSSFKTEDAGNSATYAEVPTKISVKRPIHARKATELVSVLMVAEDIKAGKKCDANYDELLSVRSMNQMIAEGLVKELMTEEEYNIKKKTAGKGLPRVERVGAHEVEKLLTDEVAAQDIVEKVHEIDKSHRAIVNVDTLSANFVSGDVVTLDALKEKKLVPKNTTFYKVLARGYLDKAITVEAQDYSLDAVKMLILTGGHAVKLG